MTILAFTSSPVTASEEVTAPLPSPASSTVAASTCTPGSGRLCVTDRRFKITAAWKTPDGQSGQGRAVTLTDDTGYFWFFQETNVELLVKVLNACSSSNRFWVFAAGLTNVQVDLSVEDTVTGQVRTYRNPQNRTFAPIQDTAAFATCSARSNTTASTIGEALPLVRAASPLALNQGRFQVSASWRTAQGATGSGQSVQLTDETGYFWFFQPSNVEMIIKVLDACSSTGRYWVFSAGLTNVKVDITVRDTLTGATKTYSNPQNTPFQAILDTSAFSTCSAGGNLPPDPGEAGKQTLAGIDSDRDGIRDDLQRYIFFNYQSSSSTMEALKQTVKMVQAATLDSASESLSLDHANDLVRAAECLQTVRPTDAHVVENALLAQALNTEQRGLAYLQYNDQLAGATFPLKPAAQWASSCISNLSRDPAALVLDPIAGAASTCLQAQGTVVFFGNGVWNTCAEANQSALLLASAAQSVLSSDEYAKTNFQMSCNPTQGHLADLWRATKQRFSSDFSAFLRALGDVDPMPDFLQQALVDRAGQISSAAAVADTALQEHIDTYSREILEGKKVVVVAHSQGNFYANLAYQNLDLQYQPSFGIVSVANPDSYVAGGGPYTTLFGDHVIGPIPGALRANIGNSLLPNFKDLSGHMFIASYMPAGSNSRGQILDDLKQQIESLAAPENPAGNGVITVTLNWGDEPDVDLHVFEPDGTHVYYSNSVGNVGFLDVDDVTSFGPEHYYVSCETLVPGTYRVGVNYYNGSAPETARIQIQAGLEVRSSQTFLPFSLGPSGNSSPIPVADIVVTGDAATGFAFTIVPLQ
jgi:hypothetical protein